MSAIVPDPVPLDDPPGEPRAVDDAARATALAGRLLDELTDGVTAARLPGWQGRDAVATEVRRVRLAGVGAECAEALQRIGVRLAVHAEVLREARARLAVLRAAQDAEFAAARSRVAVGFDPTDPLAAPPGEVLAALASAEADRAAEHARLVARVDDDAAETVRVLSAGAALVGGTPQYDADAALLHLADLFPTWGTPEVARRGRLLALEIRRQLGSEELLVRSAEDLDLAGDPAYAAAFLDALGPELTRSWLLTAQGEAADDRRTELMARVLSGLDRDASGPEWLPRMLDDAEEAGELGLVAGGLGAVLARGRVLGLSGPPPTAAAAWFGSLTRNEKATGNRTDVGIAPAGADPYASDPVALLAEAMAGRGAEDATARVMTDPDAWAVVLSRFWNDDAVRDSLILTVAQGSAEVAIPALRSALVALGTGLEDGDPDDWPLYLMLPRLKAVAPLLATALVRHPEVLSRPLADVAAGRAGEQVLTAVRGLAVTVAVDEGTEDEERGVAGDRIARSMGALPTGTEAAAFLAVREHGAVLADVMSQHVLRDEAEARAAVWDATFGIPFEVAGEVKGAGLPAVVVETAVTDALGTDGYWRNTPDVQRHHQLPESADPGTRRTYEDTLAALGRPKRPVAPDGNLVDKEAEALVRHFVGGWIGKKLHLPGPVGGRIGDEVVDRAELWVSDPD